MKLSRRDLIPGMRVAVHLADSTTVQGRVVCVSREFLHLVEHKAEANGTLVELASERLLVPRALVKLVEVMAG